VFERAPVGTGLLDLDGRWLLVNRALCEITGYTAEELLGTRMEGIVHPDDAGRDAAQMKQLLAGEIRAYHAEKRYFDAAGETVSVILSMSLVRDRGGAPLHLIAQLQDISDRKRLEDDLRALADHDPVTGVRSRRLFEHDLKLQVARSQRYGEAAGLLVIGLDSFAHVQELHGAGIAERMLEAVARALTRRLRQTDLLGRLDEGRFAVLLPHIDEDGLAVAADSVMRVIPAASVEVGADVLHPTASIGTQIIDDRTASAEQALTAADRAMRDARSSRIAR
jgi:PAS domain S-box-containing protein/diguanylate cyclase (GGDEF)-like protein